VPVRSGIRVFPLVRPRGGIPRRPGGDCLSRKEHAAMVSSPLVESRAVGALRHSPIPALRKLAIEETDEAVVIQGSVASYYLKQLAQEALMPHLHGRALLNRVAVVSD